MPDADAPQSPIEADLVIAALRSQISDLMYQNTLLTLMVQARDAAEAASVTDLRTTSS